MGNFVDDLNHFKGSVVLDRGESLESKNIIFIDGSDLYITYLDNSGVVQKKLIGGASNSLIFKGKYAAGTDISTTITTPHDRDYILVDNGKSEYMPFIYINGSWVPVGSSGGNMDFKGQFTDEAARDHALPTPSKGWFVVVDSVGYVYNGSTWLPLGDNNLKNFNYLGIQTATSAVANPKERDAIIIGNDLFIYTGGHWVNTGGAGNGLNFMGIHSTTSEIANPKEKDAIIIGHSLYIYTGGKWVNTGSSLPTPTKDNQLLVFNKDGSTSFIDSFPTKPADNTKDYILLLNKNTGDYSWIERPTGAGGVTLPAKPNDTLNQYKLVYDKYGVLKWDIDNGIPTIPSDGNKYYLAGQTGGSPFWDRFKDKFLSYHYKSCSPTKSHFIMHNLGTQLITYTVYNDKGIKIDASGLKVNDNVLKIVVNSDIDIIVDIVGAVVDESNSNSCSINMVDHFNNLPINLLPPANLISRNADKQFDLPKPSCYGIFIEWKKYYASINLHYKGKTELVAADYTIPHKGTTPNSPLLAEIQADSGTNFIMPWSIVGFEVEGWAIADGVKVRSKKITKGVFSATVDVTVSTTTDSGGNTIFVHDANSIEEGTTNSDLYSYLEKGEVGLQFGVKSYPAMHFADVPMFEMISDTSKTLYNIEYYSLSDTDKALFQHIATPADYPDTFDEEILKNDDRKVESIYGANWAKTITSNTVTCYGTQRVFPKIIRNVKVKQSAETYGDVAVGTSGVSTTSATLQYYDTVTSTWKVDPTIAKATTVGYLPNNDGTTYMDRQSASDGTLYKYGWFSVDIALYQDVRWRLFYNTKRVDGDNLPH